MNSKDIVRGIASKLKVVSLTHLLKHDVQQAVHAVAKADSRDLIRRLNNIKGSRPKDGSVDMTLVERRVLVMDEFATKWHRAGEEIKALLPEINLATFWIEHCHAVLRSIAPYWRITSTLDWVRDYVPFAERPVAEVQPEAAEAAQEQ